jgi:branched-chain amino acid transport system ATP-binding protein
MLAIAQALIPRPRVLILDEPSAGLSPIIVDEVFAAVAALKREGIGVLLAEQAVDRTLSVADQVTVIDAGRCLYSGPAEDLGKDRAVLRELYLGAATSTPRKRTEKEVGTSEQRSHM